MAHWPNPGFRAEDLQVTLTSWLLRKQVAADFGDDFSTLIRRNQQDRSKPEKPRTRSDLEREIAELWRKKRMLREEGRCEKATQSFVRCCK